MCLFSMDISKNRQSSAVAWISRPGKSKFSLEDKLLYEWQCDKVNVFLWMQKTAVYAQAFVRKLLVMVMVMVMDVTAQPPHKDSQAIDGDGDGVGDAWCILHIFLLYQYSLSYLHQVNWYYKLDSYRFTLY